MKTAENYQAGCAEGERFAERDLHDGLGNHHDQEGYFRAMGEKDVHGANNRAWYLGCARGYRAVIRSLKDGRWGS